MAESTQREPFSSNLLDHMLEGCQILDNKWRYVYVNDAAEKHSRRPRGELIGRTMPEVFPGIDTSPLFEIMRECLESRASRKLTNEFTYPDGSRAWFELWFQPVPQGLMVLSLNVTDRKKSEGRVEKLNRAVAERIKAEGKLNRTLDALRLANEKLQAEIAERQSAEEALRISLRFLEIVNRQRELKPLLDEFRAEIERFTGCEAVGIRVLDEEGNIPYQTYSGFSRSFFESESPLSIHSDHCMCINVIRGDADPALPFYSPGGSFWMNGTTRFLATVSETDKGSTRNMCNRVGYESVALIPFRRENRILGLIHVADRRENMVPLHVVKTLEKAAMQLGPAFERVRAENRLTESESRYRSLFENNHTIILLIDPADGAIVDANPAASRYYGWTRDELRRMKMSAINTLSQAEVMAEMERARTELRNHFFFLHRLADGSIRDVEVFSGPITLQGRQLLYSVIHDITDRKMAEAALIESESHYRSLFDNMLNGYAYCRIVLEGGRPADFVYLEVNDAFESLTGLRNVAGKKVSEVIPGILEADPELFEIYGRVASTGQPTYFETHVKALDMWFSISVYSPNKGYFVAVFDVITERKKAEAALRESEQKLRLFIENAPAAITMLDRNMRYMFVSRRWRQNYHVTMEEVIGRSAYEVFPESPERWKEIHRRCLAGAVESCDEDPFVRQDGHTDWLKWEIRPWHEGDGSVGGIMIMSELINERKEAEKEREKLEDQYRQSQKLEAVGRLAGGVAHDFNNMLQVINGYAEMTLDEIGAESPWHGNLLEIQKAANRSSDLTRQLLAFARKQTVDPRVLDLNDTVSGMLKMLRRLIGEDIDLAWVPGHDLWPLKIDPSQIDQVLANLAVNARDAITGVGRVTIETENAVIDEAYCVDHPEFLPGEYVVLAVSDDGCGMDRATVSRIFEPFFTTKGSGRGTGLGLATVYGIVRQNNGFVNVYSEPGQGTIFKIYLPRHESDSAGTRAAPSLPTLKGGVETVLLVEDEAVILNIGRAMLQRLGYHVLTAQRPTEAVRLAEEYSGNIDLLITDVVMPEMNGKDLALHLAAIQPAMKCLFISGYTANLIAHRGVLDQGVNFLPKPFSLEALSRKIREILD